jgi:hypothetical protein
MYCVFAGFFTLFAVDVVGALLPESGMELGLQFGVFLGSTTAFAATLDPFMDRVFD